MIALGVDPGTLHLGWGVLQREGNRLRHIAHGVVHLRGGQSLGERLVCIEEALDRVIDAHQPSVGSVETLFFHKDAQAAAKLGHARGVVLLCLARRGVAVVEYTPARVKRTVAGHGRAAKPQVAQMVRAALGLEKQPPSDAADALALAMTHLRIGPLLERLEARDGGQGRASAVTPGRSGNRCGVTRRRAHARGRTRRG